MKDVIGDAHHNLDTTLDLAVSASSGNGAEVTQNAKEISDNLEKLRARDMLKFQGVTVFVDSFNTSLSSINGAISAHSRGDTIGTAVYSLTAIATIVKGVGAASVLLGPELFPISLTIYIVGGVIELVGSICDLFRKDEVSLIDQISALLVRARADELTDHLTVAAKALNAWEHSLQSGTLQAMAWDEFPRHFNLRDGNATTFIDVAREWLLRSNNRALSDSWIAVFEAYATCTHMRTMVYFKQYASWLKYLDARSLALGTRTDEASVAERKHLTLLGQDAATDLDLYFDGLATSYASLRWSGRNMAPVWTIGTTRDIYQANVTIVADQRSGDTVWVSPGGQVARFDEMAVLPLDKISEDGAGLWAWNRGDQSQPYYRNASGWHAYNFGGVRIACVDVAFYGYLPQKDASKLPPDATPPPAVGVHALLGLTEETNELLLRYFVPAQGIPAVQIPPVIAKFSMPSPLRQARLRMMDDGVEVYMLGKTRNGEQDQVFRVRKGAVSEYGWAFSFPAKRIYVDSSHVWAVGAQLIWRRSHDLPERSMNPWDVITPPQLVSPLTGGWEYSDIHPGNDGLMLATIGVRYFAWTPEDGWLSTADGGSGGNHVKIARLPLGGFGLLKAGGDAAEKWQGAAKARQADGQATGAGMTLPPMHS